MKSLLWIWHYVINVKSRVKISSIFVAFLENMNFTQHIPDYKLYFLLTFVNFLLQLYNAMYSHLHCIVNQSYVKSFFSNLI